METIARREHTYDHKYLVKTRLAPNLKADDPIAEFTAGFQVVYSRRVEIALTLHI